jgi:hypothetical protein
VTPAETAILAALKTDRHAARVLLAERIHEREQPVPDSTDNERQ